MDSRADSSKGGSCFDSGGGGGGGAASDLISIGEANELYGSGSTVATTSDSTGSRDPSPRKLARPLQPLAEGGSMSFESRSEGSESQSRKGLRRHPAAPAGGAAAAAAGQCVYSMHESLSLEASFSDQDGGPSRVSSSSRSSRDGSFLSLASSVRQGDTGDGRSRSMLVVCFSEEDRLIACVWWAPAIYPFWLLTTSSGREQLAAVWLLAFRGSGASVRATVNLVAKKRRRSGGHRRANIPRLGFARLKVFGVSTPNKYPVLREATPQGCALIVGYRL